MGKDQSSKLNVAVYTSYTQGFYFGELVSQLHQLCLIKGYRFSLINTQYYGEYCSDLGISNFDIIILVRNAVHPELAEVMANSEAVVVSLGFDYFPLDIPVVSCDNEYGIELAFDLLLKHGHRKMAYIGEISQFDMRKRYEAFCSLHEVYDIPFDDEQIYVVNDSFFSGGYQAAREFLERKSDATGIICGAGLTAIGFAKKMEQLNPEIYKSLEITAFDAFSIFPISSPDIHIVDQNIFLIAHKAIELAEKRRRKEPVERSELVKPKLIATDSELFDSEQAFLATSTELAELHNPNYMKSLLLNAHDWPSAIAKSHLADIMMLAPLFPRHLEEVLLTRVIETKKGESAAKILRHITSDSVNNMKDQGNIGLCRTKDYPSRNEFFDPTNFGSSIHIPICVNKKMWGVLSVFGTDDHSERLSSFTGLCCYLNIIVDFLKAQLVGSSVQKSSPETKQKNREPDERVGIVSWNLSEAAFLWDEVALSLLGYDSTLEHQVYRHMEISDRVHPDDVDVLSGLVRQVEKEDTHSRLRFRHKNKAYVSFEIECQKVNETTLNIRLHSTITNHE